MDKVPDLGWGTAGSSPVTVDAGSNPVMAKHFIPQVCKVIKHKSACNAIFQEMIYKI